MVLTLDCNYGVTLHPCADQILMFQMSRGAGVSEAETEKHSARVKIINERLVETSLTCTVRKYLGCLQLQSVSLYSSTVM